MDHQQDRNKKSTENRKEDEDQCLIQRFFANQKSKTSWNICKRQKYEGSRMKSRDEIQDFFSKITRGDNVETIRLQWNLMPDIVKLISIPEFSSLKALKLGSNHISNLESLITINADNLEELFLWNNKITDIRHLRKVNLPNLRHLDLSNNKILEIGKIWETCSNKITWINLDFNPIVYLNEVYKIPKFTFNGTLLVCSNQIITAFGLPGHLNRKKVTNYRFKRNLAPQVDYY